MYIIDKQGEIYISPDQIDVAAAYIADSAIVIPVAKLFNDGYDEDVRRAIIFDPFDVNSSVYHIYSRSACEDHDYQDWFIVFDANDSEMVHNILVFADNHFK